MTSTTRVAICYGDAALRVYDIRSGLRGVSCREIASIDDAGAERACDEARARIGAAGRAGALVMVLPGAAVHLRPMAMTSRLFEEARPEIERSLESLLPIDPSGAALGFVDRAEHATPGEHEDGTGAGYLLGVDRDDMRRWTDLCRRVTGRAPDRTVAPHQAAMCAGLQRTERATVREEGPFGDVQDSILERGRIVELRSGGDASVGADLTLPGGDTQAVDQDFRRLAVGAALLDSCASGECMPLDGDWTPGWKRSVPVAAMALVCIALVLGAIAARGDRYERALDDVVAQQQTLRAEVIRVSDLIAERDRTGAMIRSVMGNAIERDAAMIEIASAIERVLPPDVFLEQLTVNADGVRLRGVAANARDILAALEGSGVFRGVREGQRPQPVGDGSGREVFDVRAAYQPSGSDDREVTR